MQRYLAARQAGEGAFVCFFFFVDGNVVVVTAVAGRTVETVTAHGQLSFPSGFTFSRTCGTHQTVE